MTAAALWFPLIAAGLVAGVTGTITGVGSVVSYPVLLAVGLPPTSANVTNTVSLAIGGVTGAVSSRPETTGHGRLLLRLGVAGALGTVAGSTLLLQSPPGVFEKTVPFLVAFASVSILVPRRRRSGDLDAEPTGSARAATIGTAVVSIYNGYFAAGSSVLMVAVLLLTTALDVRRINGLRNVVVVVSDAVAAIAFTAFGPVSWSAVPALTAGLLAGSWLGPRIARRLPVDVLRYVIACAGLALAVGLAIRA